ncbi:hypothetical protein VTO42DRAFT_7294 [Malbranchea cinnamomea]
MVRSFRELIDYLLGEISLCGERGASLADVLSFIETFYATAPENGPGAGTGLHALTGRVPNIDRRFKSRVWTWLTRHPELSVGKNREGNNLTLDEMEARSLPKSASNEENDGNSINDETTAKTVVKQEHNELRIFVSEERMWLAIAGHLPDASRVTPFEFALLSIIASRKGHGIPQPELSEISGQDKRSVPKRTDVLCERGYIEKRPVQYKSMRTSLCTLRKFAGGPLGASGASEEGVSVVDMSAVLDDIFSILKEHKLITRQDLRQKMGCRNRAKLKVLARALRKLEAIGCLRRVKALSQFSEHKRFLAIELIREPSETDKKLFFNSSKSLFASSEQDEADELEAEEEREDEDNVDGLPEDLQSKQLVKDTRRTIPQWIPGAISLPNLIFRLVDQSGSKGLTGIEVTAASMGILFRRPVEGILSRLTESWQVTQPTHLRHLALVRDSEVRGTITFFLHYSFRNYASLVSQGRKVWEAVQHMSKRGTKGLPVDAQPQVDNYGFPVNNVPTGLVNQGNSTLREGLEAGKPTDYKPTKRDPVAVEQADGTWTVQYVTDYQFKKVFQRLTALDGVSPELPSASPSIIKRKRDLDESGRTDRSHESPLPVAKRRKQVMGDQFAGMTDKERLEAQGLDESFTEYSVLCLERPEPGLYITALGKRRSTRGRPPKSRIAIFKFPSLKNFEWFTTPTVSTQPLPEESGHADEASSVVQREEVAVSRYLRKRKPSKAVVVHESDQEVGSDKEEVDNEEVWTPSSRKRGRPPKKRKVTSDVDKGPTEEEQVGKLSVGATGALGVVESDDALRDTIEEPVIAAEPMEIDQPDVTPSQSINSPKVVATAQDAMNKAAAEQDDPTGSLRPVLNKEVNANTIEPSAFEAQDSMSVDDARPISRHSATRETSSVRSTREASSAINSELGETKNVPLKGRKFRMKDRREARGGSVSILRRQIVMDIIKNCGGAHPLGTDLWYPFTTAWLKAKYKEKPDMKTVRATVGALIAAGKLRQHTFTGKNKKGLMVTKTLIADSTLDPEDPLILDMQTKMLEADPQSYFPPGSEVDPSLKKSHRRLRVAEEIPELDAGVKVSLHQTPSWALPREQKPRPRLTTLRPFGREKKRRQPRSVQRRHPNVSYLGSLSFPAPPQTELPIVIWPYPRSVVPKFSEMVPHGLTMLMNQFQFFHEATGTFGTVFQASWQSPAATPWSQAIRARIPPQRPLPENLEGILSEASQHIHPREQVYDETTDKFFTEVSTVQRWERMNRDKLKTQDINEFAYINHSIPGPFQSAPLEDTPRFAADVLASSEPLMSMEAPLTRQRYRALDHAPPGYVWDTRLQEFVPPYKVNQHVPPMKKTPRRILRLQESTRGRAEKSAAKLAEERAAIIRRQRWSAPPASLPPDVLQKLLVAIVVVRTLAGGLEGKLIEWPIIGRLFPDYPLKLLYDCGKRALARDRLQLAKLQSDFQEKFVDAYERDEVPRIDYDNLESYEWESVVHWAEEQLESPRPARMPILPATREQFDNLFEIRKEPMQNLDEIYQHPGQVTSLRKATLFSNVIFATKYQESSPPLTETARERAEDIERLNVAKSWVRANIVTPDETYNPFEARRTLERFGEELINRAIQALMTERVILHSNKGRITPGRNFDVTEPFLFALGRKRNIESTQLKRAAHFKLNILDEQFRSEGKYVLDSCAEDGDILALINLAERGRIKLLPKDPPKNIWGLTDTGYLTRMMDKAKLRFAVEAYPAGDKYIYGNPMQEAVQNTVVPKNGLEDESIEPTTVKIPLWLDVHKQFVKVLWDSAVAAVLGCVALRPGIRAEGVAGLLRPSLGKWEADLLLKWLRDVGVMEQTSSDPEPGWTVKEWWWMVLT